MPDDATAPGDQTLYYGDCLDWMRQWPDECVDLVYLDPPFNSNADYNIIFGQENGTPAQVRGFEDTWRWDEAAAQRVRDFENALAHPMHRPTVALKAALGPSGMLAYLTYMGQRLTYAQRLLKPTGSIYLHCDPTASHYLKLLMDSLFGSRNFRNEITWQRTESHNTANRYGNVADILLYYARDAEAGPTWNGGFHRYGSGKYSEQQLQRFRYVDDDGRRYRLDDLTAPRPNSDSGKFEWRGTMPGPTRGWGYRLEQLEQWWSEGRIHTKRDGTPRMDGLKVYLDDADGKALQNVWTDVPRIGNTSRERLGYPTQKPLALLERIIEASSNPGDFVLDPFCGCGTAVVAAHQLGRRWAGIDISSMAIDIVQERRLETLGIQANIQGIPQDLVSARRLASERWLDFQAWAAMRIPGMAANQQPGADAGIDGRGTLLVPPEDRESRLALAQVKGGRTFRLSELRDFLRVIEREEAACGVFITVDRVRSAAARTEAAQMGELAVGANRHPRAQLWSIEEYFQGVRPNLPALANPYTGRPIEPTIFSQQRFI